MTTIQIDLPDAVAQAAKEAGLLRPECLVTRTMMWFWHWQRSCKPDVIVSGDDDLLVLKTYASSEIVSPACALAMLEG